MIFFNDICIPPEYFQHFFFLKILAITDLHGRRVKGDKKKPKTVIDHVVFERHLTNPYGQWKIAGKITPPLRVNSSKLQKIEQGTQVSRA